MEVEVILPDSALGEGSANNHCVNAVSFRFLSFQLLCCFMNFIGRNTMVAYFCLVIFRLPKREFASFRWVQYVQQNLYDKEIKKYGKLLSFVFSPDA
jgi:hypothetical protein